MNRIFYALKNNFNSLIKAFSRFPLTALFLAFATFLSWYMVNLHGTPPHYIEKLAFASVLGAIMSAAAQGLYERFQGPQRIYTFLGTIILTVGYYLIISPVPEISEEVSLRTFVAIFALLCLFLWIPSYRRVTTFDSITLTHFKSVFTAFLYAAVLSAGVSAIIGAIDVLLFNINSDIYLYANETIWIFFMPMYYLSILPKFSSEEEEDLVYGKKAAIYPKFLDILMSRIAIPIIAIFTGVLIIYFIKILVTFKWPIGQVGPIVLGYATAGIFIFILSSLLENNFAKRYRKYFPKFLIGVVLMQLVSVGIRINAYGITESRYYVALFGIYALVCGIILSFKSTERNGLIVLLLAGFAIFSVVPPVDTFTVSRVSQISRIEKILTAEGMLSNGKLLAKENPSENSKIEITNILSYLNSRGYTSRVKWLPKDFNSYNDMKATLGFDSYYKNSVDNAKNDIYLNLDSNYPIDISGYDALLTMSSNPYDKGNNADQDVVIKGQPYKVKVTKISSLDSSIDVIDASGKIVISAKLYDEVKKFISMSSYSKEMMPPSSLSFEKSENGYSMKIILQNANLSDKDANYTFYVLIKGK